VKQKVTLAEVESYLRKAAQATGLGWGLAEEAGKAARWLAAFDLPGPEISLAHLQQLDGRDYKKYFPANIDTRWQAQGDYLCPIVSGAALADRAGQMLAGTEFKLGEIAYPLLLVATIGQAARYHKTTFTTSWANIRVNCYENGIRIEGSRDDLLLARANSASCRHSSDLEPQQLPSTLAKIAFATGSLSTKTPSQSNMIRSKPYCINFFQNINGEILSIARLKFG